MAEFQQGDDPRDHTVQEVNDYLAREDVSAEEKQRVYDAEQTDNGGQGRTSVKAPTVAHNTAPLSSDTVTDGSQDEGGSAEPFGGSKGSKPYWYEETNGPLPKDLEGQYVFVGISK